MKNRGLLLAFAAALSGAQAFAQSSVTISGTIDLWAGKRQLSGSPQSTTRVDSGGMTTSHLSFSGVEDIGGGLKAEFLLSTFFRADTGETGRFAGDGMFGRSSYVGLVTNAGTVRIGRQTTGNFLLAKLRPSGIARASARSMPVGH